MADSKKYIGIYDTLEDVQDALDNGQLSKPYVAKTMDNGQLDYNTLSPVDYSQYWCTYYPIDAKIWVKTSDASYYPSMIEYKGGDGKIPKADFPTFYGAGNDVNNSSNKCNVTKFKYFQFDSTSNTIYFKQAWEDCSLLTEFPLIDTAKGTSFYHAWQNCSSLTTFPQLDLSNGTDFERTWYGCSNLREFPAVYLTKGTNFSSAWYNCSGLTSFHAMNLSKGTNFSSAWNGCSSLTEFPSLDLSSGTNFYMAWQGCSSLTTMGQMDLSSGTNFSMTWMNCKALTNLGGFGAISADFDLSYCPLTVESIMNVINQAATVTGKTMTLGSANLAKLSNEQKAVATSKGWTLA